MNFFRNRTSLDFYYVSLGGSTEPPEPPLDPPRERLSMDLIKRPVPKHALPLVCDARSNAVTGIF